MFKDNDMSHDGQVQPVIIKSAECHPNYDKII